MKKEQLIDFIRGNITNESEMGEIIDWSYNKQKGTDEKPFMMILS